MSEQVAIGKSLENAAAGSVLIKLLAFSISLGIVPISSYFMSQKYIWNGNSTYAAITAVVSANLVLVVYIIVSLLEDRPVPSEQTTSDTKKRQ